MKSTTSLRPRISQSQIKFGLVSRSAHHKYRRNPIQGNYSPFAFGVCRFIAGSAAKLVVGWRMDPCHGKGIRSARRPDIVLVPNPWHIRTVSLDNLAIPLTAPNHALHGERINKHLSPGTTPIQISGGTWLTPYETLSFIGVYYHHPVDPRKRSVLGKQQHRSPATQPTH